ncbi:unnamed protein product [Lathyrus sativus]|nr:unnamed protein product [Lathyrus sativus]
MATTGGGFWLLYEGSISCYDNSVEHRPYHRKCGCPLHNKNSRINYNHKLPRCNSTVSFPMKRKRISLVLMTSVGEGGGRTESHAFFIDSRFDKN